MTTAINLDRNKLYKVYQEAIRQIEDQQGCDYSKGFYHDMSECIFDHGWQALTDFSRPASSEGSSSPRIHVVPAAPGSGKTTFSKALMVALTRAAERSDSFPYGCLFLVDQRIKADQLYKEMAALIPGKVAVFTRDHDKSVTKKEKVKHPAAEFLVDDLADFPVLIATHSFFKGTRSQKATEALWKEKWVRRALTIIDERPEATTTYDITLAAAEAVREKVKDEDKVSSEAHGAMDALCTWLRPFSHEGPNLQQLGSNWEESASAFQWFNTREAKDYVKAAADSTVAGVFGFARAASRGCAFVARDRIAHFVGYEQDFPVTSGMMMLDATADIDGVTPLSPSRSQKATPQARYDRLEITHHTRHTPKNLATYLKQIGNRQAYVRWMVDIIKSEIAPGQQGLVVCKKALFENQNIPNWPQGDPRFAAEETFRKKFAWEIDGRKLCATHWGAGIGFNDWKEADVVFLFDEHILPRRVVIATAQGLMGKKANEGPLAEMKGLNSLPKDIRNLSEGLTLRWLKQMALRGKGREFDEHGVCSAQKLVVACDQKRLMVNLHRIFPGAKAPKAGGTLDAEAKHLDKLLFILRGADGGGDKIKCRDISRLMGVPWRNVSKHLMAQPDVETAIRNTG